MNNLPLRNLTMAFALLFFFGAAHSQIPRPQSTTAPRPGAAAKSEAVTQVDDESLPKILKPNGKPLLVNFWATWCDPCREEFPELVKIDADYKGKIDFITVTLDEPGDIKGPVPKFLSEMKARMPAYLLVSSDEPATIASIAKDWTGGLPFTILYNEKGEIVYFRQGKIKPDLLRTEIDKLGTAIAPPARP